MIIKLNDNISIWEKADSIGSSIHSDNSIFKEHRSSPIHFEKKRILIKDRWFDVIDQSELIRSRSKEDGYYRLIYIQINMQTGEYYVGKVNRPKWSEIKRYQGSGLKFRNKFKKSKKEFVRFYIAACTNAKETEELEASIVDKDLLLDEKCLNLVAGGGGISNRPTLAETSQKKRKYMKENPDQFKPMLEASKKAFQSGDTPALRARSKRIKDVMNTDKYRNMSRERLINWKNDNPVKYAQARIKNREVIRSPKIQERRKQSLLEWREQNPEKHKAWQDKLLESRTSPKANKKRKESLEAWNKKNPIEAHFNAKKRAKAAATKTSKPVSMIDLETGEVIDNFPSIHSAARWLVKVGKAKNTNCASSISSVCLRKPSTTGYGNRKKAYGYDWRFTEDLL